jgi:RNA polymerase sigma factor (sigma-70 family)
MLAYFTWDTNDADMSEQDPLIEIDDKMLALRMKEKDEAALDTVIETYGPKVMGFLHLKFGDVLRPPELDEVFNRAVFNVWRFADRFNPDRGGMRGWFIRIARNAALSFIRGETKHLAQTLEFDPAYDPADDCDDVSPDIDSKEAKRLEHLDRFINHELVGNEREIARNCFKTGGEADSIRLAALLGKTRKYVDTVKSKVKRKITESMLKWEAEERCREVTR